MSKTSKKILIDELIEQGHPEKVENVIYQALKEYAESNRTTWQGVIAKTITSRIDEEDPVLMNEDRINQLFL